MNAKVFTLAGSHRSEPPNAELGRTHGNTKVTVALSVPTKEDRLAAFFVSRHLQIANGNYVAPLSARAFARRFGANQRTMREVANRLRACGIEVVSMTPHSGEIVIRARVALLRKVAMFELNDYSDEKGAKFHARVGEIAITDTRLIDLGVTSFRGLDARQVAHSHMQINHAHDGNASRSESWTVTDLVTRFNIPLQLLATAAKKRVVIGILELGGGYRKSDNVTAAKRQGVDLPEIADLSVDGATNSPSTPEGADGEVALDLQTCFSIGKYGKIVVSQGRNNSALAFPHSIRALVDAGADVISISWGAAMLANWTAQDVQAMEVELARADALGVVIVVASGDTGSTDGREDGVNDVDYPSASAHCTGAGGLFVGHDGTLRVWNDNPTESATGGGVSTMPVPLFQGMLQKLGLLPTNVDTGKPGRCVPDVSATADPNSGVTILVDGQWMVIGGTSFAAPFIALGLAVIIALIGKRLTGFNTYLYQYGVEDGFIIDILPPGDNGAYPVLNGYDCTTGLGAIDFGKLLMSLQKRGIAQTEFDLAA
jgi:kumamolisin